MGRHSLYTGPVTVFILTVVSRLPFASEMLFNMDSVQFALGMREFDVSLHQPHPPGYFLYVMLARMFSLLTGGEPNSTMVAMSVLSAGFACAFVFVFAERLFDRKSAWFSSLAFISSPSMIFHSEVALSYMPEALMSVLVAMACHTALNRRGDRLIHAAVLLAVAGGIRQSCFVFLLPMFLFAAYRSGPRKAAASIAVLIAANLAWFIPMVYSTGGPAEYFSYMGAHWSDSNWRGISAGLVGYNANFMSYFVFAGLGVCIAVLALSAIFKLTGRFEIFRNRDDAYMFVLWIAAPFGFHLFIFTHPAVPGHSLIYIIPLLILSGGAATAMISRIAKGNRVFFSRAFAALAAVTVISGAITYVFTDQPMSNKSIRLHDEMMKQSVRTIRENFSPADTEIIGSTRFMFNFRHAMYYLPDFRVHSVEYIRTPEGMRLFYGYRRTTYKEPCITLRPGTRRVIDFLNHPADIVETAGMGGHVLGGDTLMPVVYYDVPDGLGSFERAREYICDNNEHQAE